MPADSLEVMSALSVNASPFGSVKVSDMLVI